MSKNCKYCQKLLGMINDELMEQFEIVDVLSDYAPPQIQSVPTVLQNRNIIKQGKSAFEFIESEKK